MPCGITAGCIAAENALLGPRSGCEKGPGEERFWPGQRERDRESSPFPTEAAALGGDKCGRGTPQ